MKIALLGASGSFGQTLQLLFSKQAPEIEIVPFGRDHKTNQVENVEQLQTCDGVIPSVPIGQLESVLQHITPHLKPDVLLIDVCSIKLYPTELLKRYLPPTSSILATHPMFGPETLKHTKGDTTGLNLVLSPVRIEDELYQTIKSRLESLQYNVIEMSPDQHDQYMAQSQFYTLLSGVVLRELDVQSTPINTKSFDILLDVINITHDNRQILLDSLKYNPYCRQSLDKLQQKLQELS